MEVKVKPAAALVEQMARRLQETPDDQLVLLADRVNDLRVAMWEFEQVYTRQIDRERAARKSAATLQHKSEWLHPGDEGYPYEEVTR